MIVDLTKDEIKAILSLLDDGKSWGRPLDDPHRVALEKFLELNDIIENPVGDLCLYSGEKKLGDRYFDSEKKDSYIGSKDLNHFIRSISDANEVLMLDNRIPIIGVQEMYEGDHRYFNLLVKG